MIYNHIVCNQLKFAHLQIDTNLTLILAQKHKIVQEWQVLLKSNQNEKWIDTFLTVADAQKFKCLKGQRARVTPMPYQWALQSVCYASISQLLLAQLHPESLMLQTTMTWPVLMPLVKVKHGAWKYL